MKIYFLSSKPCALTLNGVFYGRTDEFERSVELSLSDNIYAQFSPADGLPVGFFLNEETLSAPPLGCEVYLLKEGAAIYAYDFPPVDFTLRAVDQKREGDILATLFRQGKLQLSVNSPQGYFNATLPPSFAPQTLLFHSGVILLTGENCLGVYSVKCEKLLVERVREYELQGDTLNATLPLSDSRGRVAKCVWKLSEEACALQSFALQQAAHVSPEGLLAYAFFESVLLHGEWESFLSEELLLDKENIRAFLGEFLSVSLTEEENTCGLVRKKGERLFAVEYFSVKIDKGKIIDVQG